MSGKKTCLVKRHVNASGCSVAICVNANVFFLSLVTFLIVNQDYWSKIKIFTCLFTRRLLVGELGFTGRYIFLQVLSILKTIKIIINIVLVLFIHGHAAPVADLEGAGSDAVVCRSPCSRFSAALEIWRVQGLMQLLPESLQLGP